MHSIVSFAATRITAVAVLVRRRQFPSQSQYAHSVEKLIV